MSVPGSTETLKRLFGMDDEDAGAIASLVLDLFATTDELNDDQLPPDVRSILYTLEGKKLLTFRREEYTTEDGDRRRAFYWRLRPEGWLPTLGAGPGLIPHDVYAELPAAAWARASKAH